MLLLIDNYDSFTYNVARYFEELDQQVLVVKNDAITIADIEQQQPEYIVLSPVPVRRMKRVLVCKWLNTLLVASRC